jgi:hypothetical protein
MGTPTTTNRWLVGAGLSATVALGACSESPSSVSSNGLSDIEAAELASVIVDDAEAFADASTYDTDHGIRVDVFDPHRGDGPARFFGRLPCRPTLIPEDPANVDGDRVPDAVLLDFSGVTCGMGEVMVAMGGTLGIEDPAIPGFGVRFIFTNLSKMITRGDQSRSVTWNGTRQIVGSPSNPGSQLTHTVTNFTTSFAFPNGNTAEHMKNWNAMFVADVAGSIQHGARLPSGTWSFDGNSTWVRNESATFNVVIQTTTPLHFNAECTVAPRFDAGVIVAQVSRNGETTTVTIEHTECGQKIITRS